jgi:translation elongation factor EF-G
MIENYFPCEKITIVFEIAGKSTLTDSVLAAAGTKVQEVADEAECGITIKSTGNSLSE